MKRTTLTLHSFGADDAQSGADSAPAAEETSESAAKAADNEKASGDKTAAQDDGLRAKGAERETAQPEENRAAIDDVMRKAALAARLKTAQATVERWEREAEELKQIFPSFSLEESMRSDKGFVSLVKAGVPVRLAFQAANLEKILGAAMRYAAGAAGNRLAQSIRAGAGRVRENPVLDRASSVRKKDVGSLTERDIMKIIKQVGNGERVTF